jgi:predicted hydrocarbon binding protein
MNLLYNGDITEKPTLDESYYNKLLGEGSFTGKQVKCRSMGDEYCEVEVPKL